MFVYTLSQPINLGVYMLLALVLFSLSCSASTKFERISTGNTAQLGEFPHQVSLQTMGQHLCGGSILSEEWILTAAHCLTDISPSEIIVKAGFVTVNTIPPNVEQQSRYIAKMIIHKGYFKSYWESLYWHDVGLLKLQTPFVFNEFVNKIELPDENYEPNGLVDVSGYGRTIIGNEEVRSEVLLKTQMLIRSREDCNDHVRVLLHGTRKLHINQICIGTSPQGGYPLRGDSGGPLMQNINGRRFIVGVISWRPPQSSVYSSVGFSSNVPKYKLWINYVMSHGTQDGYHPPNFLSKFVRKFRNRHTGK